MKRRAHAKPMNYDCIHKIHIPKEIIHLNLSLHEKLHAYDSHEGVERVQRKLGTANKAAFGSMSKPIIANIRCMPA